MAGQRCFIGIGSNIGDGPAIIHKALERLAQAEAITLLRVSSLYRTAAWGLTDQADFTNAVAELATTLPADQLLATLLQVEAEMGRNRDGEHWGPRLIDLDLLTYGDQRINQPGLVVPHPFMHERAFVLVPLLELEPEVEIPGRGRASGWQKKLQGQSVQALP
jgi:2-amino-4-hydroxy-6-hydroxymethyldihydropteridine diphosphokinase